MMGSHFLANYALAVAVTFGLLAALGWLAANYGQRLQGLPRGGFWSKPAVGGEFVAVSRLNLTPQHQLHHIRWKNSDLLIGTGPQGTTLLSSSPTKKPK
jgi:hypothetical protein